MLDKLKPRLRMSRPKINQIDHALRFWGVEAAFTEEDCLSGVEMRELLLDHRRFSEAWGLAALDPDHAPVLIGESGKFFTLP